MSEPINAVTGFLEENGVDYEVVEHEERPTAAGDARAAGAALGEMAKDVLLRDGDAYILAVIPASERLDFVKTRIALERDERPRLASEEELAEDFPAFEVGALPPFGRLHGVAEVVDRRLLEHDRVLCAAGDHRHSLRVDPREMVRVADARVADLCQD